VVTSTPPLPEQPTSGAVPIGQSLRDLIGEAQALRIDVQESEAARRRAELAQRRFSIVLGAALALLTLFSVLLFVVVRQLYDTADRNRALNERIADCTTAGGTCYERSGERTGAAVQQLVRSQLYIIECSRELPIAENPPGDAFDARFEKCVADRLAEPPK